MGDEETTRAGNSRDRGLRKEREKERKNSSDGEGKGRGGGERVEFDFREKG